MKKAFISFIICMILASFSPLLSKDYTVKRDGFYGSIAVGPSYGRANYSSHNYFYRLGNTVYNGLGLNADIKGGYAVGNNVILHVTLLYNRLDGKREDHEPELYPHKNLTFTSFMYGLGALYYSSPSNYFYSFSAGICKIDDDKTKPDFLFGPKELDYEPDVIDRMAFQYKMGREWRVGSTSYIGFGLSASWNLHFQYENYNILNFGVFLNSSF